MSEHLPSNNQHPRLPDLDIIEGVDYLYEEDLLNVIATALTAAGVDAEQVLLCGYTFPPKDKLVGPRQSVFAFRLNEAREQYTYGDSLTPAFYAWRDHGQDTQAIIAVYSPDAFTEDLPEFRRYTLKPEATLESATILLAKLRT